MGEMFCQRGMCRSSLKHAQKSFTQTVQRIAKQTQRKKDKNAEFCFWHDRYIFSRKKCANWPHVHNWCGLERNAHVPKKTFLKRKESTERPREGNFTHKGKSSSYNKRDTGNTKTHTIFAFFTSLHKRGDERETLICCTCRRSSKLVDVGTATAANVGLVDIDRLASVTFPTLYEHTTKQTYKNLYMYTRHKTSPFRTTPTKTSLSLSSKFWVVLVRDFQRFVHTLKPRISCESTDKLWHFRIYTHDTHDGTKQVYTYRCWKSRLDQFRATCATWKEVLTGRRINHF